MLLSSWIVFCLRAFVAAIFITYACSKLLNLSDFATTIRRHRLIPDLLSGIAAKALSIVELVLGLLFLFNIFPLIVGLAISILLVIFCGILLRARFTPGLGIQDCGCSGTNKKKTLIGSALFRNILLISASVVTVVTVGMHKNISVQLSPLIEFILLLCILAGIFCMQSGLFSSLSNAPNIETNNRGGRISTGGNRSRRSFIKWSIAGLIGLSSFLSMAPLASAAVIVPCDNGAACGCGGYSRIWNNCADIIGDSGTEYESFYTKCCDNTNQTCRYVTVELGYINCGGC